MINDYGIIESVRSKLNTQKILELTELKLQLRDYGAYYQLIVEKDLTEEQLQKIEYAIRETLINIGIEVTE